MECYVCEKEFNVEERPGGILISPPHHNGKASSKDWVDKYHVCDGCFYMLLRLSSLRREGAVEIKLKDVEYGPIPEYGDHMTMQDFIEHVECGGFIDYDGHGSYATEDACTDIDIYPSDIKYGVYDKSFTHVVWFNK